MSNIFDDYLHIAHRAEAAKAKQFCWRLGGVVVDVGCGRRPYKRFLSPSHTYVGIESSPRLRPDAVGSALALPIRSEAADSAICTEVLEHLPDPQQAVREISRVLKPGGSLYLTVPQTWGLHYEPHDYFRYTKYGIRLMLERGGFEAEVIEPIGGLFSFAVVRAMDLAVAQILFPLLKRVGIDRGKYRLAAMLLLPWNALLPRPLGWLDHWDKLNPIGWAVLAHKRRDL